MTFNDMMPSVVISSVFKKQTSSTIEAVKLFAILTMLLDHISLIFFSRADFFLSLAGRLSFPLFAYLLVHNYLYFTGNKNIYIVRLLVFALLSQYFYYIAFHRGLEPNIFFVLAISLMLINIFESKRYFFLAIAGIVYLGFFSLFPPFVFWLGFTLLLFFYFKREIQNPYFLFYSALLLNLTSFKLSSYLMPFLFIYVVSYIKSSGVSLTHSSKWFFYLFYPTHLLILHCVDILIS